MGSQNLVWTKLASGNVWWVGEKVDDPPEEIIAGLKQGVQVVKYFNPDEALSVVKNPNHIVDYETNKEEYIRKGLSLLKKKPTMLKDFKADVAEAEKRIGGDVEIIEKLEPKKPSDSTPRKSIVAEIFRTPVAEKKSVTVEKKTPPASAPAKISLKKIASPRKSKGPTPQLAADNKKYHCEKCGFGTDRLDVITSHYKQHAAGSIPVATPVVTPVVTPVRRARANIPPPPFAASTPEKAQVGRKPSARQAVKVTPVASPKRTTQPRKRKLATPEVTTDKAKEILADWSDGDEEGLGESTSREARKKPKTSKDLFDSLFQATKATSGDSTDDVKPAKEDENATDRRSDDEMDEDLALLSGSNAPISLLQKEVKSESDEITPDTKDVTPEKKEVAPETKEVTPERKEVTPEAKEIAPEAMEVTPELKKEDEVVEKLDNDLDAQFNELMSETAFKLPEFNAEAKPPSDSVEVKVKSEEDEKNESEIAKETVEAAPENTAEIIEASAKETEMPELKSEEASTSVEKNEPGVAVTRSLRSSLSPEKTKSAEVSKPTSPAPVTPKKPQDRAASPIKTYPSPSKAGEVKSSATSSAQNVTVKAAPAEIVPPPAPVYARKSAPKPIEDRPKRTTRGRRASASKAAVVEPSLKTEGPAKVETPVDQQPPQTTAAVASEASVKNESEAKTKTAEVVSSTIVSQQAEVKVVPEPPAPVAQTLTENLEAPKIPDSNVETQAVTEVVTNHTKTEEVKPVETPAVTDAVKKPSATSAPTASALALAQRKQQQQQRGVAVPTPKRQGRTYPSKKTPVGSSSDTTQGKPTATVKPTVSVEDDSISRQALQVQKGNLKSSSAAEQKEVPVEHVVHLVPVQNADGSVSYMLLSLNDSDQLQLDQFEGQSAPSSNLEAVYLDKPVDCETLISTICPPAPSQQQQQVQIQLPQVSQAPSRQPTASQQVKQISAAAAATKASTSQPVQPQTTQFISTDANTSQQFIIQQEGQELLSSGALVQSEDGSYVDLSQLASGDNNIYFMTEDGSIIDPSSVNGIDLQQFFTTQ